MTVVNEQLRFTAHLPYLLDLANRRMQQDLSALVDRAAFPELRGSHFRLLSMIPDEGARPSVLAEFAAITRPALGELVRHLSDHGYVETIADDADGRAVIVRRTRRGNAATQRAEQGIAALRQQWEDELGRERFAALLDALEALRAGPSHA